MQIKTQHKNCAECNRLKQRLQVSGGMAQRISTSEHSAEVTKKGTTK